MQIQPISYISKILWRFYGGSAPDDPQQGIKDIQYIIKADKIVLKPFHGLTGYNSQYKRKVVFENAGFEEPEKSIDVVEETIYAYEPKAVCFCDIPINHLPEHMKKYNCVGLGIDRNFLAYQSKDLQPVRYYNIKDKSELNNSVEGIFDVIHESPKILAMKPFVKIPTLFRGQRLLSGMLKDEDSLFAPSEGFDSIYEEREWRLFEEIEIPFDKISFLILPSRNMDDIGSLKAILDSRVGIIYADELFTEVGK
ncbi:MAG: hypothetical protein A2504_00440 [Bdellovibrionales bacterium RIFOXYD12_FULL_39_22]|nr:MAG: hypothetical protein A2385_14020 [Bdellovibrionales bacterium RIFOXYB1_FULL_39_21]OFZ42449.1 MAG: hypothetical protein A2485_04070 [Bdellovibrionales bacterium RIFOXYC12_FULL_39_17]OFZ45425.1 MAG: hypothetical protein A2404_01510 [Bdellovibrionales bacterium RIFOXYC1_FULL_39_130]OFZ68415.1 MAG: hypothetical protein A2451_01535 [Bdellovibrionales bacterium RIFOXYC2_FULL_39_8]OFZ74622.1 MAG: hypothetical protein A2560_09540 [Bdellovibrionales bacterium RIFOXYD1_FULL_39_84]OFZ92904.1 MAG: